MPTTAIVFVPSDRLLPDAHRCITHCLAQGYHMIGVVRDDWGEAMRLLQTGTADVIVVADEEHLDPNRTPRIEVVAHYQTSHRHGRPISGRRTRTRTLKRTAAR